MEPLELIELGDTRVPQNHRGATPNGLAGFRVQGQGLGLRLEGLGFRVWG